MFTLHSSNNKVVLTPLDDIGVYFKNNTEDLGVKRMTVKNRIPETN